jgi:hypothetical protein
MTNRKLSSTPVDSFETIDPTAHAARVPEVVSDYLNDNL